MNCKICFQCLYCLFALSGTVIGDEDQFGTLIFEDRFERSESQELRDEPGNGWTTSSDKTANGNKQVDLRDGYLHIYTHAEANHATSVRQTFSFKDGTISLRVRFEDDRDSIKLNFTDLGEKSVHAGHLFNVTVGTSKVSLTDLKTGVMNLKIREARKNKTLSKTESQELLKKNRDFPVELETARWHQVEATVSGGELTCTINGRLVGSLQSEGVAHKTKTMIRLLVPYKISVDDLRIWRKM